MNTAGEWMDDWRMDDLPVLDGFWLPASLRPRALSQAAWQVYYLKGGQVLDAPTPGSVGIRWPGLNEAGWQAVLDGLQAGRTLDTRAFLDRWQRALDGSWPRMASRLPEFLPLLVKATGYSHKMLMHAFLGGGMIQVESLASALHFKLRGSEPLAWQPLPGAAGSLRFYPHRRLDAAALRLRGQAPFYRPAHPSALALGFAAGNVPGTAFLIGLLGGLANAAHAGMPAPALLLRGSRHEPVFAPWLLDMLELADPELVAGLAVLPWDYQDLDLQARLMRAAGLMLAAAGDDTIAALDSVRAAANPRLRFHRHGHKASFSVISADFASIPEMAAQAALDASLWDQNGCLSSRVHFVEGGGEGYAEALTHSMRCLASDLPRGVTPRRFTHRAFDTFFALQDEGQVCVFSGYQDDFMVALDRRPWEPDSLRRVVSACQGRAVIVRPVPDLDQAAAWLETLPRDQLQTVGIACPPNRLEAFASAAGAAGVTAVRALGQAAFPKLAFSWDGFLPLDAGYLRPEGHWTGIEI